MTTFRPAETDSSTAGAWAGRASGEDKFAGALAGLPGVSVLCDRRMPGSRGTIDHIVVGPGGVFVVDARHDQGRVQIHNKGGLFRTDLRLYVGRRDCSALAEKVEWQAKAVERVLRSAGLETVPPIIPLLCFIAGEWPLLSPPGSYQGVRLEGMHSIRTLVTQVQVLDLSAIEELTRALSSALPAK